VGWICAGIIVFLALVALLAPVIAPQDPNAVDVAHPFAGPSAAHLFGTDAVGRDILSRLMVGARTSLLGPLLVVLLANVAGTIVGLLAAWVGGWLDQLVSRVVDAMFAIPGLLLAILAVAVFGRGLTAPVIALSIAYVPYAARVARGAALRELALPYVEALRIQGFSATAISLRHVVPNLMPLLVAQSTVGFGYAMVDLAAVSFLGLGVQPPTPDWGAMVASGQSSVIRGHPEESIIAGVTIVVAVTAFNLLGERLARRTGTGR
jgi:peptide/nickel transport system permease protein